MPAVLVELGFISNANEERLLRTPGFQSVCAYAIAQGIADFLGVRLHSGEPAPAPAATPAAAGTPIGGEPQATVAQAQTWARSRGATSHFVELAELYWELAPAVGVRPEVAYAQFGKETAFGRFGGVINESYCNPCGLKTTIGGSNSDPDAHQRFPNWRAGIHAHLDHLALYAGLPGYPKALSQTPDPRHFVYLAGNARTVEALGGRWAPSPEYGLSLVKDYLTPLLATVAVARLDETVRLVGDGLSLEDVLTALGGLGQVRWDKEARTVTIERG
ncbi:MAG: hypothetical protein C4570_07875 [Ammonifex sp.]|nr:MAG: hypothetical protein C4570_07875 [Ammonifex sp.]